MITTDRATSAMRHQDMFIAGQWVPAASTFEVIDPWDGALVATIASGAAADATAAVDAAASAIVPPPHARATVLRKVADLIEQRSELFAATIRAEAGKPITAARGEVSRGIDTIRLASDEARHLAGATVPLDAVAAGEGLLAFEIPAPVGIVAAITPFNFPLNLVAHKLGPAIAAGCPVVLKPSEKTPLTAGLLVAAFADAGLPAGMLNLVTGDPNVIVSTWLADERTAVVTFTGSAELGWRLKSESARKRHVLELGSNTAMVVAADADLDAAAAAAASASFTFSGQACISLQRVYVADTVADTFVDKLVEKAEALPVGDPDDEATVVGPLITTAATDRVLSWVKAAVAEGATLCTGGDLKNGVVAPTVLLDASPTSAVLCEEAFGPIVTVNRVSDLTEAIKDVNASRFGLNTAVFTQDLSTALRIAAEAEAGAVLVNVAPNFRADNMPYGGVKDSGQGKEGVPYAVRELTEYKLVVMKK
ncbi:aldehyde dehydrogenase family protein [Micromonospora sp. NPDC005206]|uniref:aldehyde dehydrogenase family protein n=1 Tax=Micromonospora sp. NPDC005206 TaxID=3157022 RepID=UPI0033A8E200